VNSALDHAGGNVAGFDDVGLTVIDDQRKPIGAVREIFDLVRNYDAILATGHISAEEHFAVVQEFARRGKVVVSSLMPVRNSWGRISHGPNVLSWQISAPRSNSQHFDILTRLAIRGSPLKIRQK
jgi:hypothetical protein